MTAKLFRKKPVEVYALRFTGVNHREMNAFVGKTYEDDEGDMHWGFNPVHEDDWGKNGVTAIVWDALHSTWVGVKPGQWIIRGVKGEYYPCDDEVLQETYEEVEEIT